MPSNLEALRDVGVNAIMTETESYDISIIEATHNKSLRFYAGVTCFSDHAARFRIINERPELWPILENGERRPQMEWYIGMTPTDSRRQEEVLAAIASIARAYPVDGLFLDFVRWPLHWEIELRPGRDEPAGFQVSTLRHSSNSKLHMERFPVTLARSPRKPPGYGKIGCGTGSTSNAKSSPTS